mgnify:FL=1
MRRLVILAGLLVVVAGCARSGTKVDPSELRQFEAGKTTYEEVVGVLGVPNYVSMTGDGRRLVSYIYAESQVRPETMIPFVGVFVGGVDTNTNNVTLVFDENDVLQRSGGGRGRVPTSMGLAE